MSGIRVTRTHRTQGRSAARTRQAKWRAWPTAAPEHRSAPGRIRRSPLETVGLLASGSVALGTSRPMLAPRMSGQRAAPAM